MLDVRFERRHVPILDGNNKPISENGITKMKEEHWVTCVVTRNSTVEQTVEHFFFNLEVDARTLRTEKSEKVLAYFRDQYERWQKGLAPKLDGIPIEDWSYLTKGQIDQLKQMGIHTIEHLTDPGEESLSRFMGLRDIQRRAKAFLENLRGPEAVARQMIELKAELEALRTENVEARKEAAEMKAQRKEADQPQPFPNKRDIVVGAPKAI